MNYVLNISVAGKFFSVETSLCYFSLAQVFHWNTSWLSKVVGWVEIKSKRNVFISDTSWENKCLGGHVSAFFFFSVVVCLNYSGIRAVTFFSHSALPSPLLPLDFPKVLCFMCAFLWNRGAGRVERSRDDRPRRGRMKWGGCLFSPPKPHTFLEWLWRAA